MKSSSIRLALFVLCTILFVTGLIAYSNSRAKHTEPSISDESAINESQPTFRKYEKQFTVSKKGTIEIEAEAGTISITSWDKDEVSVVVEIDGSDARAEKYTVEFSQDGNTVKVKGRTKDRSFFKWHIGSLSAHYTVIVPKEFNAFVRTSGGDVSVKDVAGKMDFETSGGDMFVEKINGETILSTSGGNIDVREVIGTVNAETSGGDVVCENIVGNVSGQTSGGDVEMRSVDGRVRAETSGGSISIRVTGENKGIVANTSGGNINISLPEFIKATIKAETTGGTVECDFPVTVRGKVRESELFGSINGGGNVIRAETSGGSIYISSMKK
jgi:hypothetical protein